MKHLWQRIALMVAGFGLLELASRIVLPGINPGALARFNALGGNPMLRLYEWVGAGGLSRGAILAVGLVPYLSARIWVWLLRFANPAAKTAEGRRRMRRDTRVLTVLLSVIQAFGFARFVAGVPGVVVNPNTAWILQTMGILVASSVAAMLIVEQLAPPETDEEVDAPTLLGEGAAGDTAHEALGRGLPDCRQSTRETI